MPTPVDLYDELVEKWRREPKEIEPAIRAALTIAEESRIPIIQDELKRERDANKQALRRVKALEAKASELEGGIVEYKTIFERELARRRQLEAELEPVEPEPAPAVPSTEGERLAVLGWRRS